MTDATPKIRRSPRLLVVDDEPNILALLRDILTAHGYEVRTALGGREGLETLRLFHPDLAILDVVMPGMDGYDLLRCIRAESDIPVIMLSGAVVLNDVLDGRREEVPDSFIAKPIPQRQLLESIKYLLDCSHS